ncbi:MAG TPA: M64 family metallopeptidase [Bacteroidales bacterium]|nr:M64 family metallopeptidase [Bacteroidales bacterium]
MRYYFILFFLAIISGKMYCQEFDNYFTGNALRFDFMFSGNKIKTVLYPGSMKEEPGWAGPRPVSVNPNAGGNFIFELFDKQDEKLIYRNGFNTLFQEWQTTSEAEKIERSFYEVIRMPFPKNKCNLVISKREKDGSFTILYSGEVNPTDYFIIREKTADVRSSRIYGSNDPSVSVDLAFIAEGYTESQMNKFRQDVKTMADALFSEAPFKEYKDKFNIWAVEAISQESGTDIPGEHIYVNTALNSTFYTFDLDRYLTTTDMKAVHDYAAVVPYDNIIVLINSEKYGGGGVYNYYSGTSTDHPASRIVFIHEFGHGFAGLADEYYNSTVAYNDFYPLNYEPWEPNITTLVDFRQKWTPAIKDGVPVPTPEEEKYKNVVGLFEGGGYSAKGIYRPEIDCRMRSNGPKGFCSVCSNAIIKAIEYYTSQE